MSSLIFYITVFLIVFILVKLAVKHGIENIDGKVKYKKIYYVLYGMAALVLILVSGLRYYVGTDYISYINIFNEASMYSLDTMLSTRIEVGYVILNKLLAMIFTSPYVAIFVTSAIIVIFIFMGAHKLIKNKNNLPYSILIFMLTLYPQSFNMVRQAMAIAICFYAYSFLFERKPIKYILFILLATSFHSSAILCLPLYFLYSKKSDKKKLRNIVLIIFLIVILNFNIIIWLFNNVSIFSKYLAYLDVQIGSINIVNLITVIPICLLLIIFYKALVAKDDRLGLLIYFIFYATILSQFASYIMYFDRIALYFSVAAYIVYPSIIDISKNKETKYVVKFVIIGFYLYEFILKYYLWGFSDIFPYNSIL